KNIYILDCMGKFNINRYMNLLSRLGISHSVLIDSDNDKKNKVIHEIFNSCIEDSKTIFTKGIYAFDTDLEGFLGIEKSEKYFKPLNIMYRYKKGEISDEKIEELKNILVENNLI
ncbi:TOPRIM nucleotidyl transferase/hydrolase domain-containing protein, partial [Thermobrachium celere]|uniref:TOPRIM nucleotidyl transferase/hydrolase domain-containing protein n=1 Tax=Thermobrachium celere TaxID=53422 RepID=UPI0035A24DA7